MRRAAMIALAAAAVVAAAPARAGDSQPSPPEATIRDEFGWQILSADGSALLFTFVAGQVGESRALVLPYFVFSPAVHLAHRDYVGAIESLALHVALPVAGYYIGRAIDPPDCTPTPQHWCLGSFDWGPPLGTLGGIALATAIDAVYLANVERPAAEMVTVTKHPLSAMPGLGVDPSGHVTLSLSGRF